MFSSTLLLSLGFAIYPYAAGQVTTTAVCTTDTWTNNDRGQSPCLVTSALQAACDGGNFNVPALTDGQIYFGPQLGFGNQCTCSTVTYSMAMACGACQGAGINKWSTWMTNCTPGDVSIGFFPLAIPSSVTIPAWAYENVTVHDLWDANEALAIANDHVPDSSALPQPTASGSSTTNPSPTTAGGSSKSKSINIAAIAGGTAGGVVLIILIALVIFIWRRRAGKKQKGSDKKSALIEPWRSNEQEKFIQPSNNNNDELSQLNYRDTSPSSGSQSQMMQPVVSQAPQQFIPYDPADPSTFPTTPMIPFGTMPVPVDQTSLPSLQAPTHSQQPSASSVRSMQLQPTSPMSYSHNPDPNVPYTNSSQSVPSTATMPSMHPNSYAAPVFTTTNQGPIQTSDPSQYIISNVPYNQNQLRVPYNIAQRGSGGYTGVAEI